MDEHDQERPIPPSKLSKTPSWITLGFVLGALFVLALPRQERSTAELRPGPPPTVVKLERPKLTEIEAVFAEWGQHAIWENDLTEVALWDSERKSYSLFYEVLRNGDVFYFRSIPRLTRPVLTHGVRPNAPLQYTETEEMRGEWMKARWEQSFVPPESEPLRPSAPAETKLKSGAAPDERRN